MNTIRHWGAALLALTACACSSSERGPEDYDSSGSIAARLIADVGDDIASIRVDVMQQGKVVESQNVKLGLITLPGSLSDASDAAPPSTQSGGDALFVLRPGAYQVIATPLDAQGKASSQ